MNENQKFEALVKQMPPRGRDKSISSLLLSAFTAGLHANDAAIKQAVELLEGNWDLDTYRSCIKALKILKELLNEPE